MDKCYYKDFIEDEKQFYLHEAGFDGREEQLFRLRVYDGKTLEEAAEIMDYGLRTVERINQMSHFLLELGFIICVRLRIHLLG